MLLSLKYRDTHWVSADSPKYPGPHLMIQCTQHLFLIQLSACWHPGLHRGKE